MAPFGRAFHFGSGNKVYGMNWFKDLIEKLTVFGYIAGGFILGWLMRGWWFEIAKEATR